MERQVELVYSRRQYTLLQKSLDHERSKNVLLLQQLAQAQAETQDWKDSLTQSLILASKVIEGYEQKLREEAGI